MLFSLETKLGCAGARIVSRPEKYVIVEDPAHQCHYTATMLASF
jgi:hypothetical protein